MLAGQVSVGGVSSTTVTSCTQLTELPLESVAVHVTSVTPSGKKSGALLVTVRPSEQLSSAVGVPRILAPPPSSGLQPQPELAERTVSAGQTMVGSRVSRTVIVAVHEDELPWISVTVSSTVLAPRFEQLKKVWLSSMEAMPQLSLEPLSMRSTSIERPPNGLR